MQSEPSPTANVTVSIVVHRQWQLALPLLAQLDHHCHERIAKVVVTVNLPEAVSANPAWRFPVEFIHNPAPRGFGANHNSAFAHCKSPWFLVLNPDIRLDADLLSPLLAKAKPDAGLLTPSIREPGKRSPEPFRQLLTPLELLQRRRAGYQSPPLPDWVAGMFMLLRSDVFAELGGFDERFFMYCEDFDLCARLQLAAYALQVVPELEAVHDAQRASHRSLKPLLWHLASFARVWSSTAFWRFRALLRRRAASS